MIVPLWASQGWFCGWPRKYLGVGGVGVFFGRHDLEQPLGCALIIEWTDEGPWAAGGIQEPPAACQH